VIVLVSTALGKPAENTTEGCPDGIYSQWKGAFAPQPANWPGIPVASLRAWHSAEVQPDDSL
jgi:hypothetical protein